MPDKETRGALDQKIRPLEIWGYRWFYSWSSSLSLVPSPTEKNKRKQAWLLILFEPQVECADFHRDRQFKLLWRNIQLSEIKCALQRAVTGEETAHHWDLLEPSAGTPHTRNTYSRIRFLS